MKQLSWEPVRRGKLYCAPACGRGCTMEEYVSAVRAARKLAKRLRGWRVRIWENLGWHYAASDQSGRLKVHPFTSKGKVRSYTALLWTWAESAPTPEGAVRKVRRRCAREIKALEKLLVNTREV